MRPPKREPDQYTTGGFAMGLIYTLTNELSEIFYVGQTVESLEERLQGHLREATSKHADMDDPKTVEIRRMSRFGLKPTIDAVAEVPTVCLNAAEATWYSILSGNHRPPECVQCKHGLPFTQCQVHHPRLLNKMPLSEYRPPRIIMEQQAQLARSAKHYIPYPSLGTLIAGYPAEHQKRVAGLVYTTCH